MSERSIGVTMAEILYRATARQHDTMTTPWAEAMPWTRALYEERARLVMDAMIDAGLTIMPLGGAVRPAAGRLGADPTTEALAGVARVTDALRALQGQLADIDAVASALARRSFGIDGEGDRRVIFWAARERATDVGDEAGDEATDDDD